ncbi:hypothetical protein CWB96_00410 [Pseudoalteromonas citrea]|uniref:Uncharacterized protein n=1 Tax=Pseudoalteromonas citrea TaxID=43655 RepID=A0A5S3XX57_9GAMM|nr:hypothetical protein [Pseudoalteromonas citrea]TMP46329.1 hypothetical protein CWB97_02405 [Pseudoalteromonas citrea]TMP63105.1 hypothetical protein CWB96_00410 [Pseudoalteromonas citrea]
MSNNIIADHLGALSGSFKIPEKVPASTYDVTVEGDKDSTSTTTFSGQGQSEVTQVQDIITNQLTQFQRYDPLAQTFTFDRDLYLAAADVWFTVNGQSALTADLRTTENGIPTQTVLRRVRLEPSEISTDNNTPTRLNFDPILLEQDIEYCLVLMSDDPDYAVEVATLGEFDTRADQWVSAQPFQIGVLLSSSNAVTWTPHQKTDLRFKLHEAIFSSTVRSYELGKFDLYNADLVQAEFMASRHDAQTDVNLVMTLPDSRQLRMKEGSIISLGEKVSGQTSVKLELTGTRTKTPQVLAPVTLLSAGVKEKGVYITKHIALGESRDVRVGFDVALGLDSKVTAFYAIGPDWYPLDLKEQRSIGNGFHERRYQLNGASGDTIRIKLELEGTANDAPRVRPLRVTVL